ncbi:MAG: J domain-containing protein [Microcystaceae cyanobacterium]
MDKPDFEQYYQLLGLSLNASADEIQEAYLHQVAIKRREGQKRELESLKLAYQTLWEHTLQQDYDQAQATPQDQLTLAINEALRPHHLQVITRLNETTLTLIFDAQTVNQSAVPKTLIHSVLADIILPDVQDIKVMGKRGAKNIAWRYQFPLSEIPIETETEKLLKQGEANVRIWGFPAAIIIALSLNLTGLNWFWNMWMHELGHAVIAWFSGYRAMPTLAVTITSLDQSLFVYFGILFLLCLLFWSGKNENQPWTMGLGVILILVQFQLTWMTSRDTYEMLQAFGGVGGEFYLSTFFMVAFYFTLPQRLYWEFWRYLALILSASTFINSFTMWHRINKGRAFIPWGTFWGGKGDAAGDMNMLTDWHGWSDNQIIDTYRVLGNLCLWVLIGVYIYFLFKSSKQLQRYFRKN